jgi:hypothetical protein
MGAGRQLHGSAQTRILAAIAAGGKQIRRQQNAERQASNLPKADPL